MHLFWGPPSQTGTKYKTPLSTSLPYGRKKNFKKYQETKFTIYPYLSNLFFQSDSHSTMVHFNAREALRFSLRPTGGAPLVLQVDVHRARIGVLRKNRRFVNRCVHPFWHPFDPCFDPSFVANPRLIHHRGWSKLHPPNTCETANVHQFTNSRSTLQETPCWVMFPLFP